MTENDYIAEYVKEKSRYIIVASEMNIPRRKADEDEE